MTMVNVQDRWGRASSNFKEEFEFRPLEPEAIAVVGLQQEQAEHEL